MYNQIKNKYLKNINFYYRRIIINLKIFCYNPIYYLKDYLRIIKASTRFVLTNFPNFKGKKIIRKIDGIYYIFDFNYGPIMRAIFLRFYSSDIIKVMLRYIQKGSTFIDIGANIGYVTAVGAGRVGRNGHVHSFEPIPKYFNYLKKVKDYNADYNITVNNFALGEKKEEMNIYICSDNFGSNTMISGWMNPNKIEEKMKIEVNRLDKYLLEKRIQNISLIKIDVEGFELHVLKGMSDFFEKYKNKLPPIILEIIPGLYSVSGTKIEDLKNLIEHYSYEAYSLDEKGKIDITKLQKITDVIIKQEK